MKNRIILILVVILIIFSITSCKRKPDSLGYESPSAEGEVGTESEPESQTQQETNTEEADAPVSEQKQQQQREHFPLQDFIYDYEKIVDPQTDPDAKVLYDAYGDGTVVIDHNNIYSIIMIVVCRNAKKRFDKPLFKWLKQN